MNLTCWWMHTETLRFHFRAVDPRTRTVLGSNGPIVWLENWTMEMKMEERRETGEIVGDSGLFAFRDVKVISSQ